MTMTLKAQETARRNLSQRIQRLLAGELSPWQADMVATAIDRLRAQDFDAGERMMMMAERPELWEATTQRATARSETFARAL